LNIIMIRNLKKNEKVEEFRKKRTMRVGKRKRARENKRIWGVNKKFISIRLKKQFLMIKA